MKIEKELPRLENYAKKKKKNMKMLICILKFAYRNNTIKEACSVFTSMQPFKKY